MVFIEYRCVLVFDLVYAVLCGPGDTGASEGRKPPPSDSPLTDTGGGGF